MPAYDDAPFSPDAAVGGSDDPRLLLWAAGELDALPQAEARALRQALDADPALRASAEALRDDLNRVAALTREADVASGASTRVRHETKRALRGAIDRPAVAGRIGRPIEADASSQVWRWVRWPLAAAAALVAGLTTFIFLDSDVDRPGLAFRPETGLVTPFNPTGREGSDRIRPDSDDRSDEILDEQAEQLVAMFEMPSLAWESMDESGEVPVAETRALMIAPPQARDHFNQQLADLAILAELSAIGNVEGEWEWGGWGWDELGG